MQVMVTANESSPLLKENNVGANNGRAQHLQLSGPTYSDINESKEGSGDNDAADDETHQREDDIVSTLASVAGNVLEWYDFAIYGYFSDIIGR